MKLDAGSRVQAASEQVSADLKDEAVVLGMRKGLYYGLDPVGAYVWKEVQHPRSVEDVVLSVVAEFSVDAERATGDVLTFLQRLLDEELIDIVDPA